MYVKKGVKLQYGETIEFFGTYSKASEATNYKAFDYNNYLKIKKIYGIINANRHNSRKQRYRIKSNRDFSK